MYCFLHLLIQLKANYTYTFLFLKAMKYPEIYYLCVIDL